MINHYQTLGLDEGASQEAIQEAYDRLYKELNPANNDNQEFFIEEFEKLQEAYKVLRNSSILSVTAETAEELTLNTASSAVKKTNRKLKPKKASTKSKVKTTNFFIMAIAIIISGLIAYILFQSKQYELSQITITNDDAYSAFTRADMKPFTGNVKGGGTFINGLAEGEHNKLDKNGNCIAEGHYKNGQKIGVWKEWYPLKDGKWHFWYEKRLPKKECNYNNGILVKDYNSWYINGQLEKRGTFGNGIEKGIWYYYDIDGKILVKYNFDKQKWSEKNLDVARYKNGDLIPEVKDEHEWSKLKTGAWCYYNNDPENGSVYGKLYNWYAVNDPRGLAPEGFHVASALEWQILIQNLGGENVAGWYLKSRNYRLSRIGEGKFGIDLIGLNLLPGGYANIYGWFSDIGYRGAWWTSSIGKSNTAKFSGVYSNKKSLKIKEAGKSFGLSVRCIKD